MPPYIKFAVIKWLPLGIITTGLSTLMYRLASEISPDSSLPGEVILGWLVMVALTLGLQVYGEYRHSQAMAARKSV